MPKHSSVNSKLKIGLIVDSNLTSNFIYELVQWCQSNDQLYISHLLFQEQRSAKPKRILQSIRELGFSIIARLETVLLKRMHLDPDSERNDLNALVSESLKIAPVVSGSDQLHTCSGHALAKIRALNLDLLLMAGSGKLQGYFFEVSRFGVISPCLSETNADLGRYTGFWEVFHKQDYTGFSIRQQVEADDRCMDLVKGRITTQYYHSLNKIRIEQKCAHYLKETLTDIALNRRVPEASPSSSFIKKMQPLPDLLDQFRYAGNLGFRLVNKFIRSKLRLDLRWNVAYQKCDWPNIVMGTAIKINNPDNHFLADPFVISIDNEDYCFVEDYDYSTQKGHIAAYHLHDDRAECLGNALVEPFHLSFPYLFRYQSELYMCPETSGSKQIRVYKCTYFPLRWELHATLMEGLSAVDTMLFERDGKWWMLTNIDRSGAGDHCSELCLFWSDSPLSSVWHTHPMNPLLIDTSKGRNAGLLTDNDFIYRVAQKQGFERYGKAFSIHRIDQLDENKYREIEIRSVQADFFPGISGTHHMHSNGTVTAFDFI